MKSKWLFALFLLILAGLAHAEGGCPSGMIPYRGTDISSCGPIPNNYYENNANDDDSEPVGPHAIWKKTWGAIAFSKTNNAVGVASGLKSKKAAQEAALADCRTAGGGPLCEIGVAYHNQCAAVA